MTTVTTTDSNFSKVACSPSTSATRPSGPSSTLPRSGTRSPPTPITLAGLNTPYVDEDEDEYDEDDEFDDEDYEDEGYEDEEDLESEPSSDPDWATSES